MANANIVNLHYKSFKTINNAFFAKLQTPDEKRRFPAAKRNLLAYSRELPANKRDTSSYTGRLPACKRDIPFDVRNLTDGNTTITFYTGESPEDNSNIPVLIRKVPFYKIKYTNESSGLFYYNLRVVLLHNFPKFRYRK